MRKSIILRIAVLAVCAASLLAGCADMARKAPVLPVNATGVRDGASYRIDIPANWNHELIVYYHGYQHKPVVHDKDKRVWPALPIASMSRPTGIGARWCSSTAHRKRRLRLRRMNRSRRCSAISCNASTR